MLLLKETNQYFANILHLILVPRPHYRHLSLTSSPFFSFTYLPTSMLAQSPTSFLLVSLLMPVEPPISPTNALLLLNSSKACVGGKAAGQNRLKLESYEFWKQGKDVLVLVIENRIGFGSSLPLGS